MKEKIILDIRLFEERSQGRNPNYIGELYTVDKSIFFNCDRYARKLRELGFITGDFNHVYLVQTPYLEDGVIIESEQQPEKWLKYYYIGVSPEIYNQKSEEEKQNFTLELTTNVLKSIATTEEQRIIVDRVYCMLSKEKSSLEIIHLTKQTKKYELVISYQIRPLNMTSRALIEYKDLHNQVKRKSSFLELKTYEDIFYLISSITILNEVIYMKPRQSETANYHIKSYKTPIAISIDEIPIV
ncbi:hypothetical protein [Cohnella sp.]|uniref:hypothetical protein n=1 Tax=Cohnella sp. TaxID=1883426 RepID=UPI00356820EF